MTDKGKEKIEDTFKISMPLITNLELQELDNNMDSIVEQYTKLFIHNKELAMLQHIIKNQQAEIENLKTRKERQLKRFGKYKENIENKHEEIYEDLVQEIEKQDKIIDEMAKVLADYKYEEIICMEVDCEHIELQNEGTCIGDKACIKEYFKKKVGTEEK